MICEAMKCHLVPTLGGLLVQQFDYFLFHLWAYLVPICAWVARHTENGILGVRWMKLTAYMVSKFEVHLRHTENAILMRWSINLWAYMVPICGELIGHTGVLICASDAQFWVHLWCHDALSADMCIYECMIGVPVARPRDLTLICSHVHCVWMPKFLCALMTGHLDPI